MKQRVAIARTLINQPKLVLMDEPFGALDPQTRWGMQSLLLDVSRTEDNTILFVTHDVSEAVYLGGHRLRPLLAAGAHPPQGGRPLLPRPRRGAQVGAGVPGGGEEAAGPAVLAGGAVGFGDVRPFRRGLARPARPAGRRPPPARRLPAADPRRLLRSHPLRPRLGDGRRLHLLPLRPEPGGGGGAGLQPRHRRAGRGVLQSPLRSAARAVRGGGPRGPSLRRLGRAQPAVRAGRADRPAPVRPAAAGAVRGGSGDRAPRPLPLALGGGRLRAGDAARPADPDRHLGARRAAGGGGRGSAGR